MRSVIPIIEQFDRAADELKIDHPLNGRIALILVDNGLELMCHQKCADLLFDDRHRKASPRLTPEQRNDARGRVFDRKIELLKTLGHIPAEHVKPIAILHKYRNQLYHVGLRDDPIISQIAHLYYGIAVGLLGAMFGVERHLKWEPEIVTELARRLVPELATAKRYRTKVNVAGLRDRLLAMCSPPLTPFETALSDHLQTRIGQAEASFNIIAMGRSGKDDPNDTLRIVQMEADTLHALIRFRQEGEKKLRAEGRQPQPFDMERLSYARGTKVFADLNVRLLPKWKPRHIKVPFGGWRKQARSISIKGHNLLALEMFDRVIKEIDNLEDIMADPIEDMHGWHQHLEDVAMDNR